MCQPPARSDEQANLSLPETGPTSVPIYHPAIYELPFLDRHVRHIASCTETHNGLIILRSRQRKFEDVSGMGKPDALPAFARPLHPQNPYLSEGTDLTFLGNHSTHMLCFPLGERTT